MNHEPKRTEVLTMRVTAAEAALLRALADMRGETVSDILREAVERHMERANVTITVNGVKVQ